MPTPFSSLVQEEPPEEAALDRAIDRAFNVALQCERRRLARQRRARDKAVAFLEEHGLGALEEAGRKPAGHALFEALLVKSWSLRHENPSLMVRFALEALKTARGLDASRHSAEWLVDCQCRAWIELGNAYRVVHQFDKARNCFERAIDLLDLGTGNPLLHIRLLDLQASLAADLHNFPEACMALTLVRDFHRARGDNHMVGRNLIKTGIYTGYAGNREKGIRLLREGMALVDERREPGLVLSAVHNQLWFLVESGFYEEAKNFHFRNLRLFGRAEGKVSRLKIDWLVARIEAGLSRHLSAELGLRDVVKGFEEAQRKGEAALATLDLAAVLLVELRPGEAKALLLQAARSLNELENKGEVKKAVLLLRRAAEAELEAEVLRRFVLEIAAFLRRAEHDPNARFELSF